MVILAKGYKLHTMIKHGDQTKMFAVADVKNRRTHCGLF